LKVNREIKAAKVRVIGHTGEQIGILSFLEAMARADEVGLDLVEISPSAVPPVCKIMNFGKFRYDQTKREKESKKSQHQVKVKEIKIKPNTDVHDLQTKMRQAREFLVKGYKVKVTCAYRGREMAHPEIGKRNMEKFCQDLEDIATPEGPMSFLGRLLIAILAPGVKKKKETASKGSSVESSEAETSEQPDKSNE
jgi:translation initiation factor IF-3